MFQMLNLLKKLAAESRKDANPNLPELPFLQAALANVYVFFRNTSIPAMGRFYEMYRDPEDYSPHKTQSCIKQRVLRDVRGFLPEAKKHQQFLWFCRIFLINSIRHWPTS